MKSLTEKEEEIMSMFWWKGKLFVREIQELYPEPKPHINTISTIVRILEKKGFVGHESINTSYRYFALISKKEYCNKSLKGVVSKYFNNSFLGAVSSLLEEEELSVDELKELIDKVEAGKSSKKK
jgi:predicted transcriptional regulator